MDAIQGQRAKLSFIVLVDGSVDHLAECLDSILGQTVSDIELVCLCTTSAEGFLGCAKEFALRNDCVSVISYGGDSLIVGIREAVGQVSAPLTVVMRGGDVLRIDFAAKVLEDARSWGGAFDLALYDAEHVWRGSEGLRRELVPAAGDRQVYGRPLAANEAALALSAFCVPCASVWRTGYLSSLCDAQENSQLPLRHYSSFWLSAIASADRIVFEQIAGYGSLRIDGIRADAMESVASLGGDFRFLCESFSRSGQSALYAASVRVLYGRSVEVLASSVPSQRREAVARLRTVLGELEVRGSSMEGILPLDAVILLNDPERYYCEQWGSYDRISELETRLSDALLLLEACRESAVHGTKASKAISPSPSLARRVARKGRSVLRSIKRRIG